MTTYIPFSLFEQYFPDDESSPKKRSKDQSDRAVATEKVIRLRTRAITTYPEGRIVVGRALPAESGEDVVEITTSQLKPLPFYENGDLLAIKPDIEFVREEILSFVRKDLLANGNFSKKLFSSMTGSVHIGYFLETKFQREQIADRNQYKLEIVQNALGTFLSPGMGYANSVNRKNWLQESCENGTQSWIAGMLSAFPHHVAIAIDPDIRRIRRGEGDRANTNNYPIVEYVRIQNALAQIYCHDESKPIKLLENLLSTFTTDKPEVSRKAINDVQPKPDFTPPPYLGDLKEDLRERLTSGTFELPRGARKPERPLPKYYGAKEANLLSEKLMKQNDRVRAGIAAYHRSIHDPGEIASRVVVYQFDVFMHDKQVKKVDKGVQFRSYLPKDERLRPILAKLASTTLSTEDSEIVKTMMSPNRRTLPQLGDKQQGGVACVTEDLKERSIALAELSPMEEWVYRDANEFDIPERLKPWANECCKIAQHDKEAMLRQIRGRVQQAAQELVAQKLVEDDVE